MVFHLMHNCIVVWSASSCFDFIYFWAKKLANPFCNLWYHVPLTQWACAIHGKSVTNYGLKKQHHHDQMMMIIFIMTEMMAMMMKTWLSWLWQNVVFGFEFLFRQCTIEGKKGSRFTIRNSNFNQKWNNNNNGNFFLHKQWKVFENMHKFCLFIYFFLFFNKLKV